MLRRVLSVLQRQPALRRHAFAGAAALGLALACLNPQNDDLPSSSDSEEGTIANGPSAQGDDNAPTPAPGNAPEAPNFSPEPQDPGGGQSPPLVNEPGAPPPADSGDDGEAATDDPDAGAAPDAGSASAPDVAP